MKLRAVSLKDKIYKPSLRKEKGPPKKIGNEKGEVTTDTTETPRIIRLLQLYSNKIDNYIKWINF